MEGVNFNMLPEDCVSKVLSLTCPQDACRSSLVSSTFRSAAESDILWETFLPSDYREIVANSVSPLKFSSKKELFFRLCDSVLIDGGKKTIAHAPRAQLHLSFGLSHERLLIKGFKQPRLKKEVAVKKIRQSNTLLNVAFDMNGLPQFMWRPKFGHYLLHIINANLCVVCWSFFFALEKSSGKISYKLSARELSITWSNYPMYWCWKSMLESRFSEVVELITTCWLEIHGKISTKTLSPNTTYGAYLIIKITNRAYGLDSIPSETFVEVGKNQVFSGTVCLRGHNNKKQQMEGLFYAHRAEILKSRTIEGDGSLASERHDGWMEIEIGDFFSGEGDEEVKMSLMEVKGEHLKGGFIIEGIEVRPKNHQYRNKVVY